jgi:hypothetical protein
MKKTLWKIRHSSSSGPRNKGISWGKSKSKSKSSTPLANGVGRPKPNTAGDVDFTDTIKKHKERQPVKKKHWWSK